MIEFAEKNNENELKAIWKTVFNDTDFFINLYFKYYFTPNNTLIFKIQDKIASMLFMHPYKFRFWDETIFCYYLSGLATLPEFRSQGIMNQLIDVSNKVMQERNIPLAILIPSDKNMYSFYSKSGYKQVFDKNEKKIPLKSLIDNNNSLVESYAVFDKIYREKDFCIQKKFADFQAIIADWEHDRRPPKTNIAGMAKLIAPHFLFDIFKQNTGNNFKLNLVQSDKIYLRNNVLTVNVKTLCRLLFGFRTSHFSSGINRIFPEHKPVLNLMLE